MGIKVGYYQAKAVANTFTRGRSKAKPENPHGTPYYAFLMRTEADAGKSYAGGEEILCTIYITPKTADRANTSLKLAGWKPGEALPGGLGTEVCEIQVKDEGQFGLKCEIVDPNRLPPAIPESDVNDFDAQMLALMGAPAPTGGAGSGVGNDIPF